MISSNDLYDEENKKVDNQDNNNSNNSSGTKKEERNSYGKNIKFLFRNLIFSIMYIII